MVGKRRKFERGEVEANAPPTDAGANHVELFGAAPETPEVPLGGALVLPGVVIPLAATAELEPDAPAGALTTQQVCERAGLSRPTLLAWVAAGYVRPSVKTPGQQGERALWSEPDAVRVTRLRQVVDRAKEMCTVDAVASALRRLDQTARDRALVLTGTGVRLLESSTLMAVACRELREPFLVIGLGKA